MKIRYPLLLSVVLLAVWPVSLTIGQSAAQTSSPEEQIDFERARTLLQKKRSGATLTTQEEAYLRKALQARNARAGADPVRPPLKERETVGLKPLTEMTAEDRYKDQDGGLYGAG